MPDVFTVFLNKDDDDDEVLVKRKIPMKIFGGWGGGVLLFRVNISFRYLQPHTRLDFRRLPGPVFDPPRRETAGRVTL